MKSLLQNLFACVGSCLLIWIFETFGCLSSASPNKNSSIKIFSYQKYRLVSKASSLVRLRSPPLVVHSPCVVMHCFALLRAHPHTSRVGTPVRLLRRAQPAYTLTSENGPKTIWPTSHRPVFNADSIPHDVSGRKASLSVENRGSNIRLPSSLSNRSLTAFRWIST